MTDAARDRPAVLGGTPLRPEGPPDWPGPNAAVAERVRAALADGSWGKYHGPHTAELTALLAAAHGVPHAILCASGTAAVELALRGVPVGPGDEVVMAAYDFKGNFTDVLTVGAIPVLVDVLPGNWNLDVGQVARALSPRTRAILVSHLHGGVVELPVLMELARERGIAVIEDAAQMPGARIHGRIAGTWGDVGVLSFGGSKLVSAGRGGALLTPRDDIAQRVRRFTQRGNEAYPLSELQAAAVIPQWQELDAAHARRAAAADSLAERLSKAGGLSPFRSRPSDSSPGYYKLGLQYDAAAFGGLSRDRFAAAVRAEGIALDPGFRALQLIHSARRFRAAGELTEAGRADAGILTLHHPVLLGSQPDLDQVVASVQRVRHWAVEISQAATNQTAVTNDRPGSEW